MSKPLIEDKIKDFLKEDTGYGDITTAALIDGGIKARAQLFLRKDGVAAGLEEAAIAFTLLGCKVVPFERDGSRVPAGRPLMEVHGPAWALLACERTVLNLVGRMSGIATTVSEAMSAATRVNPAMRVAATRKTAPGLRELDKRAVELGGGDTHRLRLDDCVLIKDNHLKLGLTVGEAIAKARRNVSFTKKIEVEVRSLEEAAEAAEADADMIMFDNMSPGEIMSCFSALDERGLKEGRIFEASGGITMDNVTEYAGTGVDVISMGSLTHSVRNLDAKLEIERA